VSFYSYSFANFIIHTKQDMKILVDSKIIVNWIGDATMINSVGLANLPIPDFNSHYFSICNNLNNLYKNLYNKYKVIFLHEYFNTL